MTLQAQGKKSFLSGYEIRIAAIQQDRVSVERTRPQKTARADGREHSDDVHFGPKQRAVSNRNVA
jgi:hypothetical protein